MRQALIATIAVAFSIYLFGCSTTVSTGVPPGCSTDDSLACLGGGRGWTCAAGDNPESEVSGLSCSVPRADGPNDDFCCVSWTNSTTCRPDDGLTSLCQYPSYGYVCAANDSPEAVDPSLSCSAPVADGPNDDFCCQQQ
jgi:hypothetical protein